MGWLTMFPLSWLKEKRKIWTQVMFLFIISGVGNRMNMQEVKKMHALSVSFEQCMSSNGLVEKMVDELW